MALRQTTKAEYTTSATTTTEQMESQPNFKELLESTRPSNLRAVANRYESPTSKLVADLAEALRETVMTATEAITELNKKLPSGTPRYVLDDEGTQALLGRIETMEPNPTRTAYLRSNNDSADLELVVAYLGYRLETMGATLEDMQQHSLADHAGEDDRLSDDMVFCSDTLNAIVARQSPNEDPDVMSLRNQALEYLLNKGVDRKTVSSMAAKTMLKALREQKDTQQG